MKRKHHYLYTETEYYQAIEKGLKKFEFRENDEKFKRFDIVHFKEVVHGFETGRETRGFEIKYIQYGGKYGIHKDYCIFNW